MTVLFINTTSNQVITVGIEIDGKKDIITQEATRARAQLVLPLIEDLLKKNNLIIQDISHIEVEEGPGSFTGVRVGVAIANSLGALLGISVNKGKVGELAEPKYN